MTNAIIFSVEDVENNDNCQLVVKSFINVSWWTRMVLERS